MSSEKLDESIDLIKCKNCNNQFQGNFCNQCGQKVINKRITIKHLFEIAFDSFNLDRGLLFTVKMMFSDPGKLIRDYLNGRTKDFYNPLKYLLLIASISAVLMLWFKIFDANLENTNKLMGMEDQATRLQTIVADYFKKFLHFVTILSLPFYSLVSKWLFSKHRLNYAEHLTINSYLFAQITLIQIFTILLIAIIPALSKFMILFSSIVFITYYTYALKGVFNIKLARSLFSSIAIYIIGMLLMMIFFITTTITVLFLLKLSGYNLKEIVQ